jgi:hypothetical protein
MPGRKPSPHLAPEGIDQSVMPKTVDQLSREGFQQKRLGFGEGQPSRLQVEQLVVVQTAAGGAMPADNIVGEDFKLRLIVHRGHVGQKHSSAKHLTVGLLRARRDMDFSLEYAGGFLVENIFEGLAADASLRGVLDVQGRIGMLAAAKKGNSA